MLSFITENYIVLVLIVGFSILLSNRLNIEIDKKNKLRELLLAVIIMTICSSIEKYLGNLEDYNYARVVFSFICYSLRPFVVISFISLLTENKIIHYFKYLTIINCLIYSTCFFSDIAFGFTDVNSFVRGPLGYSSHILCIFYLLLLIYLIIKKHNNQNWIKTIMVTYIGLACFIGFCFDWTTGSTSLFDDVILIGVLIYYLYLYMEYNKIDPLTCTFNRATFYNDIEKYKKGITSVVSIDMNDLKKINDTYGHVGGDTALTTISNIFLNTDQKYVRVYRVGGDEFVVLCFYQEKERVKEFIKKVKDKLSKTDYSCSFGFVYNDNNDIYELYKEADDLMYKEKEKFHANDKNKRLKEVS